MDRLPFDPKTVSVLARRELRDSLRDWRIVVPVFLLTAIFPFIMTLTAKVVFNFLRDYGAVGNRIGTQMIPFGLMVVGFFPTTFSLVVALETFVGEKERHSIEALLATPASDLDLYLGKMLPALLLPLSASYVGLTLYLLSLQATDLAQLSTSLLVQIFLLTTLTGLVMVSGAVVVSAHTTSVRAANLLASFIIIPTSLLVQVEAVLMFWGDYRVLWWIMLGLLVVAGLLIRAGMRTFNREEILSRELDTLNLRRIAEQARRFWQAGPNDALRAARSHDPLDWSLGRFYRHDLPLMLRRAALPIAVTTIILLAGFALGWRFAQQYPLPPGTIRIDEMASTMTRTTLANATPGYSLLPKFSLGAILMHNLRATVLSLLFALFSFGSLSMLLVMLPMTVVGFLGGQIAIAGSSATQFLTAFILPHGLIELPATTLAAAFALRIGAMMVSPPPRLTVGEGLLLGLADFAKIFLLVILPMLGIAALIEIYITPAVIHALYAG